ISIISRFSAVVPSLTRHSYNEYESVHTISGIGGRPRRPVIILRVVRIAIAMSTPLTMPYVSDARTLRVTRLHLVEL
ncbi:hypothetical protein EJ07DRAFT_41166, partial [Lizonia empirigonia]